MKVNTYNNYCTECMTIDELVACVARKFIFGEDLRDLFFSEREMMSKRVYTVEIVETRNTKFIMCNFCDGGVLFTFDITSYENDNYEEQQETYFAFCRAFEKYLTETINLGGRPIYVFQCRGAILAYTDGFELEMSAYPTMKAAQAAMRKEYNERYDSDYDKEKRSYCDEMSAQAVRDGEEIWLWSIAGC